MISMIHQFIHEAQVRLVAYDLALGLLGKRFFMVSDETRQMMWSAA